MEWWIWILIGLCILAAEIFVPSGFFLLLFGLSFLLTGGLVSIGLNDPAWLPWIVCSALTVILVGLLRKPLMRIFGFDAPSGYVELHAEDVIIKATIAPGEIGQGELRGTVWKVRNVGSSVLKPGERCKVQKIDGLTLETGN